MSRHPLLPVRTKAGNQWAMTYLEAWIHGWVNIAAGLVTVLSFGRLAVGWDLKYAIRVATRHAHTAWKRVP